MLLFTCTMNLGLYFCYDIPGLLETSIEKTYNKTSQEFPILYSVYSYPNMILPVFGGVFLDVLGTRPSVLLFCSLVALGNIICAIGAYQDASYFWVITLGRFVFGLGGESLSVVQSAVVAKWFKGKELALALACNLTIARLGNVIIGLIVTPLSESVGLGGTFAVGAGVCVFSFITAVMLCFLDKYADKYDGKD